MSTCKTVVVDGPKCSTSSEFQFLRKVKRHFVGDQSLADFFYSLFENQVDSMVESIYDTTRANTATSQTIQTEGATRASIREMGKLTCH